MESTLNEKNKHYINATDEIIANTISNYLGILKKMTSSPGNGVTRLPFSKEARKASEFLAKIMQQAGLNTEIDDVGNVRGILPATVENQEIIIIGSHYDTVKNGGAYDGIAGVVCAIEIAMLLNKYQKERNTAVEVIAFNDEEGCMFGSGCLGSKTIMGMVDNEYLNMTDENGISIRQWITSWNKDPKNIPNLVIDASKIRSYFEIHIEQGPVLNENQEDLGVVNCIVGLIRCTVTVTGRADHAGTTPMNMRSDAMNAATSAISQLSKFVDEENNGSVATCGFIRAHPNAINVVASKVEFTLDIRSSVQKSIDTIFEKEKKALEEYCKKFHCSYDIDVKLIQNPVYMNDRLVDILQKKCSDHDYVFRKMTSGAAHDAMIFADKVPSVMVFTPSKDGRSHCPEEYTDIEYFVKAVRVVYETISEMLIMD